MGTGVQKWFRVKATRLDGSIKPVYLQDEYYGNGLTVHDWCWGQPWSADSFGDLQYTKGKLRTKVVRHLRSLKEGDGSPLYRVQIVEVDEPDGEDLIERIVWPKEDIPLLDRIAAL